MRQILRIFPIRPQCLAALRATEELLCLRYSATGGCETPFAEALARLYREALAALSSVVRNDRETRCLPRDKAIGHDECVGSKLNS